MPDMRAIVLAGAGKSSDIAATFDGLLQDSDASESEWWSESMLPYGEGYASFVSRATNHCALYSPHSQALNISTMNLRDGDDNNAFLEFHMLSPDGPEQRPYQVVCVHRDYAWAWTRVAVFSSHTMEWQVVLPEMDNGEALFEDVRCSTGMVVNGFVSWVHKGEGCILALNTATFEFSWMELPPPLTEPLSMFQLGHTKDGKFCVVCVLQCMLSVWLWATDDEGFERFMLHKMFSLLTNASKITMLSEEADVGMRPMAVINGFVYISAYRRDPQSPQWFLSFCLETDEMNLLYKESQLLPCIVDPYIMVSWPSSLINGKEDSETGVKDDGHMGTGEAPSVLFTALQSFNERLIDDGNSNFAEIDSFLLDDERDSLLKRIATLESGLAAARDRVLRIHTEPNSMNGMELITSVSELAAARDPVLRIGTESDSMEGMERVSCWQMCKVMLGRVCLRFFTR